MKKVLQVFTIIILLLAVGALALLRLARLVKTADVVAAMTIEGALGSDRPFDPRLHALRPHPGQLASASNLRRLLAGSPIVASHHDSPHMLQDAYSLRCAPQVHGATRDALEYARGVLDIEVNAVSDNPVVFPEQGDRRVRGLVSRQALLRRYQQELERGA